jgi:hypothetical protein
VVSNYIWEFAALYENPLEADQPIVLHMLLPHQQAVEGKTPVDINPMQGAIPEHKHY